MSISFQRPPVLPSVLTLCAMVILLSLGLWQVQRLEWKQEWLSAIEDAYAQDEDALPPLTIEDFKTETNEVLFKRGRLEGQFLPYAQKLGIRTYDAVAGYHAIGLLKISENAPPVIINAGWRTLESDLVDWPDGNVSLSGTIRNTDAPHLFTPQASASDKMIYALEPQKIAEEAGIETVPPQTSFFIDSDWALSDDITPHDKTWRPNNNHLHYAIFWFLMAGTLSAVYILRFMRKSQRS